MDCREQLLARIRAARQSARESVLSGTLFDPAAPTTPRRRRA